MNNIEKLKMQIFNNINYYAKELLDELNIFWLFRSWFTIKNCRKLIGMYNNQLDILDKIESDNKKELS